MDERAVLYARVSTDEQGKGYSLPTQLESCRKYAAEQGYIVVAEFTDMHTGTEIDRPGLNELYQFVEGKNSDVLIVHDVDRLSREVKYQAVIEVEMERSGVRIEYALSGRADTPDGELLELVKAGIAQFDNRKRVENSRRGKVGRVKAGYVLVPAGRAPFGYDYVSEKRKGWLVIKDDQARIVKSMYKWLVEEGLSSYAIARRLWNNGVLSKGDTSSVVAKKFGPGSWSPSTVRRIISNPVYKGVWYYGKTRRRKVNGRNVQVSVPECEWIPVAVPAIVDETVWDEAQSCLARNKLMAQRNAKRNYLLRGMVFCPCGRRWVGRYKNHLKRAYYRCPSTEAERWRHKCENRFGIRQEILEDAVWEKVASFFLHPENLSSEIARQRAEVEKEVDHKTRRLDAIAEVIADIDRKMGVLLDEVLAGGFSQSLIDQKKKQLLKQRADLLTEAKLIEGELEASTVTPSQERELAEFARRVGEALTGLQPKDKRRTLELIRLRVDVTSPTRVKLTGIISSEGLFVDLSL